jgi:hypothetical protein
MIRIVAVALTLGVAGTTLAVAQTAPGTAPPPSVTPPPAAAATAPPRPITGPAAMAPSAPSNSTVPPAVSTGNAGSQTAAAPVAGANSFTESEARSRLEAHGYSNVSGLQKDAQSIWRGTATKNGQSVGVALDYQGNIVAQ